MNQLYQWLRGRTSLFRSKKADPAATQTVRTEVTVHRESTTLLVSGPTTVFDTCPLCGQKLAPAQAERARLHLVEGTTAQDDLPADGTSP
jgi:hypothetical protein